MASRGCAAGGRPLAWPACSAGPPPHSTPPTSTNVRQVDTNEVGGEMRYLAHAYTGGQKCELTGKPRSVEVRYTCHPTMNAITSVKEPASCSYVITLGTPKLCKHPAFRRGGGGRA